MLLSNAYPTNPNRIQQNVLVLPDMKTQNNVSSITLKGWFQWNKMIFDHILRCILSRSWVNPPETLAPESIPPSEPGVDLDWDLMSVWVTRALESAISQKLATGELLRALPDSGRARIQQTETQIPSLREMSAGWCSHFWTPFRDPVFGG